jgi:hypothetical protein
MESWQPVINHAAEFSALLITGQAGWKEWGLRTEKVAQLQFMEVPELPKSHNK